MKNSQQKLSNLANKEAYDPFDLTKLPSKYLFDKESLSENKYVDDNSLFVYYCISKGLFSDTDKYGMSFLFLHPFEWTSVDFTSFLLSVSKKYDLEIENIKTLALAIEDDYEISDNPSEYEGTYKWILELEDKNPKREEVVLFNKFFTDTASVLDLERALIYADRIAPLYDDETSELYLSKHIFKKILDYTSFSFTLKSIQQSKLKDDINSYLEAFMQEKLARNSKDKKIGNAHVNQSQNIYTFKKHNELFTAYLKKMQNDFGNILIIENKFEDGFPNLEYPEAEYIRKRYAERNFFFMHIFLVFEKQGFIKISYLGSNWNYHEDHMLAYIAKIEILPKFTNEDLSKKLHFDEDKSRFYVQGKEIKLFKFKDEYHTLRIIFEDLSELSKEWFFSEIAERIDEADLNDKKYYNAIYQIKLKLAKKGIEDFFITTKQSVKINQKYLS